MKKQLIIVTILITLILIAFAFAVKITENMNNKQLVQKYTISSKLQNSNVIKAPSEKVIKYHNERVNIWLANLVISFVVPALFLFLGLSSRLKNFTSSKSLFWSFATYFIVYSMITTIISLPLDYYSSFILKHSYGLSNQLLSKWLTDYLKEFVINAGTGAVFIVLPYLIIKKFPSHWWLYMGLLSIPILLFITFISPMYIDPLFNKYGKVQNSNLEAKIYEQLDRAGIKNCNVYQVNKSEDTKEMNAYMTGVFNSKRIVLWDTTINNLSEKETLGVLAHEMGHYLMGHVWKAIILGGIFSVFILYITNKSALWVLENSRGSFGFTKLHDIASVPLLILIINIFMFVAAPAVNSYTRYTEKEADRFELELNKDNQSAVGAMVKLHETSLSLPTPGILYKLWLYDHPTYEERVSFLENYRPWEEGKKLKYERYIKK